MSDTQSNLYVEIVDGTPLSLTIDNPGHLTETVRVSSADLTAGMLTIEKTTTMRA